MCAYGAYQEFSIDSTPLQFFQLLWFPMTAILPVPLGYFFFQRLFLKTVSKRIFLCWLAHCGSFDPCSMFKERQQRYWRGLPRDGDPGSVLIHFTLWMVAIRGVGREKFEFVASRAFDDTEYFLGVGVIKGR